MQDQSYNNAAEGFDASLHGLGLHAQPPEFCIDHSLIVAGVWQSFAAFAASSNRSMLPVRAMCVNVPLELLRVGTTSLQGWAQPQENETGSRSRDVATILSLLCAGTQRRIPSGQHAEFAERNGEADEDEGKPKKKALPSINYYKFFFQDDTRSVPAEAPMFTFCVEDLLSPRDLRTGERHVVALRIWKLVFDEQHSDSELWQRVINDQNATRSSGRANAVAPLQRKVQLQKENDIQRQLRGEGWSADFEFCNVHTPLLLAAAYRGYGGRGRPPASLDRLPAAACHLNSALQTDAASKLGGWGALSPEHVLNAKRASALAAGLVEVEACVVGVPALLGVDGLQLDPENYFAHDGRFKAPLPKSLWFNLDPTSVGVFNTILPHPVNGGAQLGEHLLRCYKEGNELTCGNNAATSLLIAHAKNRTIEEQMRREAELLRDHPSDQIGQTGAQRAARAAKARTGAHGQIEAGVTAQREPIREVATETNRIRVVAIEAYRSHRQALERELSSASQEHRRETQRRLAAGMDDLIAHHLERIKQTCVGEDASLVPPGWKAVYDGLVDECKSPYATNGSAYLAFGTRQATEGGDACGQTSGYRHMPNDVTPFAHAMRMLFNTLEDGFYAQGRDRRVMLELFFNMFDRFSSAKLLLMMYGEKGSGKSIRTSAYMHAFPKRWVHEAGPSSAKAGQNGDNGAENGSQVVYNEPPDDLVASNAASGNAALERWKKQITERLLVLFRTVSKTTDDGSGKMESFVTTKIITAHDESWVMLTNLGPLLVDPKTASGRMEPAEVKKALLDRFVSYNTPKLPGATVVKPADLAEAQTTVAAHTFRMFVSLVGVVRMAGVDVPAFQADTAYAQRVFAVLDTMLVREYNLPAINPRRSAKRLENLQTLAAVNAVAKVFLLKTTACLFDPIDADGRPRPFDMKQLVPAIKAMVITPEMILYGWSHGLDYCTSTSKAGIAAMTVACERMGLTASQWLFRPSTPASPEPASDDESGGFQGADSSAAALQRSYAATRPSDDEILSPLVGDSGTPAGQIRDAYDALARGRRSLVAHRLVCLDEGQRRSAKQRPDLAEQAERVAAVAYEQAIRERRALLPNPNDDDGDGPFRPICQSLVWPSLVGMSQFYSLEALKTWENGGKVPLAGMAEVGDAGVCSARPADKGIGNRPGIEFGDGSKTEIPKSDTAWLSKGRGAPSFLSPFLTFAKEASEQTEAFQAFGFTAEGLVDTTWQLMQHEDLRLLTEEPSTRNERSRELAFCNDADGDTSFDASLGGAFMRKADRLAGGLRPRHPDAGIPDCSLQMAMDQALVGGRLPALNCLVSDRVLRKSPLRVEFTGDKQRLELNTAVGAEHTRLFAEAALRCAILPGLQNRQEPLCNDSRVPPGFSPPPGAASLASDSRVVRLPYADDVIPISVTLDASDRFYDSAAKAAELRLVAQFSPLLGPDFLKNSEKQLEHRETNVPDMSLRYCAFSPNSPFGTFDKRLDAERVYLTVPQRVERNPEFPLHPVGDQNNSLIEDQLGEIDRIQAKRLALEHAAIAKTSATGAGQAAKKPLIDKIAQGDLMNSETWRRYTFDSYQTRCMSNGTAGLRDAALFLALDEPTQFAPRLIRAAAIKASASLDAAASEGGDDRERRLSRMQALDAMLDDLGAWEKCPSLLKASALLSIGGPVGDATAWAPPAAVTETVVGKEAVCRQMRKQAFQMPAIPARKKPKVVLRYDPSKHAIDDEDSDDPDSYRPRLSRRKQR